MKNKTKLHLSIKQKIYLSFSLLVFLFVANGIITIITLNNNRQISNNISAVIEPSLQSIEDFEDILVASKMYTTNWVFLRGNAEDKEALIKLHQSEYPALKLRMNGLISKWQDKAAADSLRQIFKGFEEVLSVENSIMGSLETFEDYEDPVTKLEAESLVEDEVLPRTSYLIGSLSKLVYREKMIKAGHNKSLEHSSAVLRTLITILAVLIIACGILLSLYMSRAIISPINKIRNIVNDLGKGLTTKVDHKVTTDEIGSMVQSVNNLSEKLRHTAAFATEIGNRNFNTFFEPLGPDDSLGVALVAMRDNIKSTDAKFNEAQHIAHIGSWERYLKTDAIVFSDEVFNIFDIEPTKVEMNYHGILKFVHPDDVAYVKEMNRKNLYMDTLPFECRIITGKGKIRNIFLETKVVLGTGGEVEKTFGIVQDITQRKADEQLLQHSEASLETKNKELLLKNKELEQFAYVASHDLQEPLRTTASFVKLLQKQYKGKIDAGADKYLTYIGKASDRMQVLIKDLLDYSLIGTKKEFTKVDCNKVLQNVIADIGATIKETDAQITADELPEISGYDMEIKQLFQNLIINAIKFRKKSTTPKIKISVEKCDRYWQFAVEDNGIGIAEQHQERIFVIFQRLHNRSEYEGSGIGLSHCRKIVELHGGKIWINSQPGQGTTFYFTIQHKTDIAFCQMLNKAS